MNDHVHKSDYPSDKLCFAIGWSKFSPEDSDYALQINTDLVQSDMPDANIPQDRFYTSQYRKASLQAFNETNFLQVMTLATKVILDDKVDLSVMYTPMNTKEYDNYSKDAISMLLGMTYESIALCIA